MENETGKTIYKNKFYFIVYQAIGEYGIYEFPWKKRDELIDKLVA